MLSVIFDVDDVLTPWAEPVHRECIRQGIAPPDSTWTKWEMWEDWPNSPKAEWIRIVDSLVVPDSIYHAPPYPGAQRAVFALQNEGWDVHFVTARGFHAHAEEIKGWTKDWVAKFFPALPAKNLWFAQDKGVVAKIIEAKYALDDRFDNVLNLKQAGVDAFLMNQPHNRSVTAFPEERRVNSALEFVERILDAS